MGFSTNTFLFIFLLGTLAVYIPTALFLPRMKVPVLLAASLIFYSWADVTALPVLLVMTLINYGCGILIERYRAAGTGASPVLGKDAPSAPLFFPPASQLFSPLSPTLPSLR